MEKSKRYDLIDKTQEPDFEYILLTGTSFVDYYLYNRDELEEAFDQLRAEAAKGFRTAHICKKHFSTRDRTWRVKRIFKLHCGNKVVFDEDSLGDGLHIVFYVNAGQWMNPK